MVEKQITYFIQDNAISINIKEKQIITDGAYVYQDEEK